MKSIQVTQSSMPAFERYVEEIKSLWESRWLTNNGEKHQKFEQELVSYLQSNYISLFSNGHQALEAALSILPKKGEIITTPFTFVSTTHAIKRMGHKPVFCDIDTVSYTIDPEKIENLISNQTVAILPVHVYGNICDVVKIQELADKYKIPVIYDAAHAFGVLYNGKPISSYGDISMFSFHATKVFNTIEGGALAIHNQTYKDKVESYKNFGLTGQESVDMIGTNAKMNEFQAAMGICNLENIQQDIQRRRGLVRHYRARLENVNGITLNFDQPNTTSNAAYFPVRFDGRSFDRDSIYQQLLENGVFSRKYFYPLVTDFSCYKEAYDSCATPVAKKVASEILTLPLYSGLNIEEVDYICDIILEGGCV